jgi:enterochelin esterase family protein
VNQVIAELAAQPGLTPESVHAFLAAHRFPLVEGRNVTFVFHGDADRVELVHWIHALQSSMAFSRLAGTDLWHLSMELPPRSRVEYKFAIQRGEHHELIRDPLNDRLARDPYGSNSVVHGEGYLAPDWILDDPFARQGEIVEVGLRSSAFGDARPLMVYLPARFRRTRRYPLVIFHDGPDYVRFAALRTVLDNLIHRLEIPPLIAVMTASPNRLVEYADDERHARFLVEDVIPALEKQFPLVSDPSARGLAGASFGAVASLSTAWRHKGRFGRLLLQSGSFAFTDIGTLDRGPHFQPVIRFVNAYRADPALPATRMFLSCGMYESLIYYNRSLVPLLTASGIEVRFVETPDGHNWENWRDRLREGLTWLFPGPLWAVYE